MSASTATGTACAFLCWCGADDGLDAALVGARRRDMVVVRTASEFLEAFHQTTPEYVVLGGKPVSETLRLLQWVRQISQDVPVLVALGEPGAEDVRLFLRKGADDVLWVEELPGNLPVPGRRAAAASASQPPPESSEVIFHNEAMTKVVDMVLRIAPTDSTVLIQGESGTGKEVIAGLIHNKSPRCGGPFVPVNCGAIPEPLLESQLYGHEKGSFTGAIKQHKGMFETADNGTILLDEIGELGLEMQVKLLRFLQSKEVRRVGGCGVRKVNVRVLAATNRDLKEEVARGRFRLDLYYRINVITLYLPSLKERSEEIQQLVEHFVKKLSAERGVAARRFSDGAVARMRTMPWPGNVRELENAVERLLLLAPGDVISEDNVVELLDAPDPAPPAACGVLVGTAAEAPPVVDAQGGPVFPSLADVERVHIERVLRAHGWNKMRSARVLGINVKTLYNKIRAYRLAPAQ